MLFKCTVKFLKPLSVFRWDFTVAIFSSLTEKRTVSERHDRVGLAWASRLVSDMDFAYENKLFFPYTLGLKNEKESCALFYEYRQWLPKEYLYWKLVPLLSSFFTKNVMVFAHITVLYDRIFFYQLTNTFFKALLHLGIRCSFFINRPQRSVLKWHKLESK